MKLCLISSIYKPYSRGGAETVVERIITGLLRNNHEVVLITLGRKAEIEHQKNLTIYRITPFNIFSFLDINSKPFWLRIWWLGLDVFNISGARAVRAIAIKEKPDVVFTHNIKGIGYLVPRAIRKLGLLHVHTLHDVQLSRPSGLILHGHEKPFLILDKVYEKVCRWLWGSPAMIVSPSIWLKEFYRRLGFFQHTEQLVLPNPIVFEHGVKTKAHTSGARRLLYVGHIEHYKGIDLLIRACGQLAGDWQLDVVGTGRLKKQLERQVEDDARITFHGWVEPKLMPQMYSQADLTIVPSLCYENSPTVIYESLVANVPVVAADIGGVAELVKDDYNGFTFAPGNIKNLTEVLQHFIDHPDQIQRLKKNCFVSVRAYGVDRYIEQLLEAVGKHRN